MRRASIYALLGLAMAGLVAIGLIAWAPWSADEDAAMTSTQEEARAAAEGFIGFTSSREPRCTLDRRASDEAALTFDCTWTETAYQGLPLDLPFRKERQLRIQGTRDPAGTFNFAECAPAELPVDVREFWAFADCRPVGATFAP